MEAMVWTAYGPPGVLQLKEVEKPAPKDNGARVKVHAASLNAADLEILRGVFIACLVYKGAAQTKKQATRNWHSGAS